MGLGRGPAAECGRSALSYLIHRPSPARASLPVSKAWRDTHSYFIDRQSRSMKMLSIQRPRPSMETRTPAAVSTSTKRGLVN